MDQELLAIMPKPEGDEEMTLGVVLKNFLTGEIELQLPAGPVSYHLKPLSQLYGQGQGQESVQTTDDTYLPLLMTIEGEIANSYREDRRLTDGEVMLSLKNLSNCPEAVPATDHLAMRIQVALRMFLSMNDFSRQEVRQSIRKVLHSVERHNRSGGPRGYLNFIIEYL